MELCFLQVSAPTGSTMHVTLSAETGSASRESGEGSREWPVASRSMQNADRRPPHATRPPTGDWLLATPHWLFPTPDRLPPPKTKRPAGCDSGRTRASWVGTRSEADAPRRPVRFSHQPAANSRRLPGPDASVRRTLLCEPAGIFRILSKTPEPSMIRLPDRPCPFNPPRWIGGSLEVVGFEPSEQAFGQTNRPIRGPSVAQSPEPPVEATRSKLISLSSVLCVPFSVCRSLSAVLCVPPSEVHHPHPIHPASAEW
jgi:hypothetical protein